MQHVLYFGNLNLVEKLLMILPVLRISISDQKLLIANIDRNC